MLVKGFKGRMEEEMEVKEQSGRERPSLHAVQGSVWLNACSVELHSFLPMRGPPSARLSPTLGCLWFPSCS